MKFSNWVFNGHLDEGEKIMDVAHRHVLVFKFAAFKAVTFGITFPIALFIFFPQAILVSLVWLSVGMLFFVYHFIDWYFDAWLLTSHGVIDIERHGLFSRQSTRIDYHMIEGIAYTIDGVLPTIFNYGDITVDKLGNQTSVNLADAANPKLIERKIIKYQDRFVSNKSVRDHFALKDMLSEMIAYHIQNNKIKAPKRD